jgi:EF-hand domain-containing protein 1
LNQVEFGYNPKAPPLQIPADYLGIGSEEDTLQNVLHLVPKPPVTDYHYYNENQGVTLRFAARMVPAKGCTLVGPYDADRR